MKWIFLTSLILLNGPVFATSIFVTLENNSDYDLSITEKKSLDSSEKMVGIWYEGNEPKDIPHGKISKFGTQDTRVNNQKLVASVKYKATNTANEDVCYLVAESDSEKVKLKCDKNLLKIVKQQSIVKNGWAVYAITVG